MTALRKLTLDYMNKALERKSSPLNSYSDPTEFPEVERCYQIAFSKESPDAEEQQLYENYCDLQKYHGKSEGFKALNHLKQLPICKKSTGKEEVKREGQKGPEHVHQQNAQNSHHSLGGADHKPDGGKPFGAQATSGSTSDLKQ